MSSSETLLVFSAPVQELLEFFGNRSAILGRWELLRWNSRDTNLLIGADRPAQELLNSGPHTWWQLARLLDRDILHGVNLRASIRYSPEDPLNHNPPSTIPALSSAGR
jgi:hypothetical protein